MADENFEVISSRSVFSKQLQHALLVTSPGLRNLIRGVLRPASRKHAWCSNRILPPPYFSCSARTIRVRSVLRFSLPISVRRTSGSSLEQLT